MSELPEIVAYAERLACDYQGAERASFAALHLSALKTYAPSPSEVCGASLTATDSRGKYLFLHCGDFTFVLHLMQGGCLRPDPKQARRPRSGMARWVFADDKALLLTEAGTEHKAGVWLLTGDPTTQQPVDHLGPDENNVSRADFVAALESDNTRAHGFMRDQRRIAGVGRLLANEILFSAKLSPFAMTTKLSDDEID